KFVPKEELELIEPIKKIIDSEQNESNLAMNYARRNGWEGGTKLSKSLAQELALFSAKKGLKRMEETEKILEKYI
ncbi:MAG: hypothetical protein ABIA76_05150, partial [Candidatus Diapherotrites archaeon]